MNSSIASLPFNVVSILALVFFNNPLKTSRFVLLSSTAKIFIFGISNSSLVLITSVFISSLMFSLEVDISCGIIIVNLEPTPTSLSTSILPFIASINFFVIASPRPVPSKTLFLSSSSLLNEVNRLSISFLLIPHPVSLTEMITLTLSLSIFCTLTSTFILPAAVYLSELSIKFNNICSILILSPISVCGISLLISTLSKSPFASNFFLNNFVILVTVSFRL